MEKSLTNLTWSGLRFFRVETLFLHIILKTWKILELGIMEKVRSAEQRSIYILQRTTLV